MSQHSAPHGKPDSSGFFGAYGGQFVPDSVKARLDELTAAMEAALVPAFCANWTTFFFIIQAAPARFFTAPT